MTGMSEEDKRHLVNGSWKDTSQMHLRMYMFMVFLLIVVEAVLQRPGWFILWSIIFGWNFSRYLRLRKIPE